MATQIMLDQLEGWIVRLPGCGRNGGYNRILFLLAVLIVFVPNHSMAQETLRFDRIDTRDGLSQNTVFSVLRDSRGFTWLGTQDGLVMYDG